MPQTTTTVKMSKPKTLKGFAKLKPKKLPTLKQAKEAVDRMGYIDSQVAPLIVSRGFNRATVVEFANGKPIAIDGQFYRGTVSFSVPVRYDSKKLKQFLTPRQLRSCLLPPEEVVTVKIVSLKSVGNGKAK
jgi:hypothetical protein